MFISPSYPRERTCHGIVQDIHEDADLEDSTGKLQTTIDLRDRILQTSLSGENDGRLIGERSNSVGDRVHVGKDGR